MQGIVSVWRALTMQKRMLLIGALAATVITFSMLARTASSPTMTLLYAGLDPSTSGEVLTALERLDVATEVRGDAIYVASSRRDSVRMALANEGLPQQGQAGFELLDGLNGFSTTSDLFDATFWRAKEGELARTILATPGVKSARVHLSPSKGGTFSRNAPAPKGAVTVTMKRGALNLGQAQSIRFLVASAVPGLMPEQVAVMDSNRGVVLSPGEKDMAFGGASDADDRERRMEEDVLNILNARVGQGNARVQVALELVTEREAISERVIDPNGRVVSGKDTTEVTETSSGANSGSVTVASNLPEGDATGSGGQSRSERTQTDETLKYEMSEIRREREKMPGGIKRLSVAVLVNQISETNDAGESGLSPRTEDELNTLRELVAQAVGLKEERGDTLTVKSLAFQAIPETGEVATNDAMGDFVSNHLMTVIQIAVLSLVTLVLGLFVVKPVLSAENLPPQEMAQVTEVGAVDQLLEVIPETPDAIEALKGIAHEKTDETTALIKAWLDEPEEAA